MLSKYTILPLLNSIGKNPISAFEKPEIRIKHAEIPFAWGVFNPIRF